MLRHAVLGFVALAVVLSAVAPAGALPATQDQVTLTVSVVDRNGDGVGGATIQAEWDDGSTSARTASNGMAFVDIPEGADVSLQIDDDTYVKNFPTEIDDASAQEVTMRVAVRGSATIRATDQNGAVEDATVFIERDGRVVDQGPTNANGGFNSKTIEQGEYTLVLFKEGYYTNETRLVVNRENVQREVPMRTGSVQVEFRVFDDHFDPARPVNDAQVAVGDLGTARTTDGTALFAIPVNSRLGVNVTKDGYETATRQLDIRESSTTVRLTIQREAVVRVQPNNERVVIGESTRVSVVNAYGEPLRSARVLLNGEEVGETNSAGEATVTIEEEGENTIRARSGSLRSDPVTVTGVTVGGNTPTASPTPSPTATASPTPSPTPSPTETSAVSLPGFTPVVAVLGLLLTAFLLRRR